MNSIRFKMNYRVICYVLLGMLWTNTILVQFVRAVLAKLPITRLAPDLLISIIYVALILLVFSKLHLRTREFFAILIIVGIFFISPVVFPKTREAWEENAVRFILYSFPYYFVGKKIFELEKDEDSNLIDLFAFLSAISIITGTIYKTVFAEDMTSTASLYHGDMNYAYNILPHCCLTFYYAIKKKQVLYIVSAAIGIFFLMLQGTRGPIILIIMFSFYCLITGGKRKFQFGAVVVLPVLILFFLFSPAYNAFLNFMYSYALRVGLSVRAFSKLLNNEFLVSTARDDIRQVLLKSVSENMLTGGGLFLDRTLVNTYAHNLPIELWVDFGIIIGSILLVFLLIVSIRAMIKETDCDNHYFIVLLFTSGILKLFFSGSYLNEPILYILMGISLGVLKEKRSSLNKNI